MTGAGGGAAPAGDGIVRAATSATSVFVLTAVAAAVAGGWCRVVAFAVAVSLFVAGLVAFLWAYVLGVRRSRRQGVGIAGLYFLAGGSAPPAVRRALLSALAVQVVAGVGTAAARPFTSLAAGTLVPLYGLGLCGLWAARHGTFPPRPDGEAGPA